MDDDLHITLWVLDLKASLQKLLKEASSFADEWTDVNRKYGDRRSFPTFSRLLQMSGLDWHNYIVLSEDNAINVSNQPNSWSSPSYPKLTSDSNWGMANKFYRKTFSLMRVLQIVREKSPDEFSRNQAELLESFLGHLIVILQEQRVVACGFSEHLEQLRKSGAALSLALSPNAIDGDGDREPFILPTQTVIDYCPFVVSEHTTAYSMWQQKHLFDSLYIITRESTWLLRKLKDSCFTSPSFIKESHEILEIIVPFISKFKKSKESLDQYLVDKCLPFIEEDKTMQLMQENKKVSDDFENHMKDLQAKGVGKGSVIENLLCCLGCACEIPMDDYGEKHGSSSLDVVEYTKVVQETIVLVEEARKKLNSDRFSTLTGGSPLGNITLWRILFESSLVDLRLDLIFKKNSETIKFGLNLLGECKCPSVSCHVQTYMHQLHATIGLLLSDGDRVLLDFVAMHRTVAEITYMLGDAFSTGGAGMKDLSDERITSKNEEEMEVVSHFPWDKHNVLAETEIDFNDPNMRWLDCPCTDYYDPEEGNEFVI